MEKLIQEFNENFERMLNVLLFQKVAMMEELMEKVQADFNENAALVSIEKWQQAFVDVIEKTEGIPKNYLDYFQCEFSECSLTTQMRVMFSMCDMRFGLERSGEPFTALECFKIAYKVPIDLKRVFCSMTMTKYDLIFKNCFCCAFIGFKLFGIQKFGPPRGSRTAICLRHNMLMFFEELLDHMRASIEKSSKRLLTEVKDAKSVLELAQIHTNFIDEVLCNCAMEDMKVYRSVYLVYCISVNFIKYLKMVNNNPNPRFYETVVLFRQHYRTSIINLSSQLKKWVEIASDKYFICFDDMHAFIRKIDDLGELVNYYDFFQ